jgi:hypothetical protein
VSPTGPRTTWIAFVPGESKTQRTLLQKAGFDFLVREPVHPIALRVLLQRALFSGAEARRTPRVACGHAVTYKTGLWRQRGTLVDLSLRGCRLLTAKPVKDKAAIHVQIPKELAGGRALDLPVTRCASRPPIAKAAAAKSTRSGSASPRSRATRATA